MKEEFHIRMKSLCFSKSRLYESNGIFIGEQLIITFESSVQPLDKREFELLIEKYLI